MKLSDFIQFEKDRAYHYKDEPIDLMDIFKLFGIIAVIALIIIQIIIW